MVLEWKMLVHWGREPLNPSWRKHQGEKSERNKKTTSSVTMASVEVQTEHVTIVDQEILRNEIQAAVKAIASSQIICMVYIPMPERGFLSMLCNT